MSTRNIGRARQGRRIASNATGVGTVKPFELKAAASNDETTDNSATPFIKFTGSSGSDETGEFNVCTADITSRTSGGAVLVDVGGTQYWIALYEATS